jgi:GNAT superfamily N-acetyltransferase
MAPDLPVIAVRVAGPDDVAAIAALRTLWSAAGEDGFEARMAAWLAAEGDRRTTWLATAANAAVGMASLFEYRRMPRPGRPQMRWGYVSNMFVREEVRNRGVGSALLAAIVAAADERGYARLVLSPAERAIPFYERAGFLVPDGGAGPHRLLVRPAGASVRRAARPRG